MASGTAFPTRLPHRLLPLAALFGLLVPVLAEERSASPSGIRIITKAQANRTDCSCRLSGQNLPVGSEICMQSSLFRCQMDQNVTTWRPLDSPCPQS